MGKNIRTFDLSSICHSRIHRAIAFHARDADNLLGPDIAIHREARKLYLVAMTTVCEASIAR